MWIFQVYEIFSFYAGLPTVTFGLLWPQFLIFVGLQTEKNGNFRTADYFLKVTQ
jgi:hypothetical protein